MHYFYDHDRVLEDQRTGTPRAATVSEIERGLIELYREPSLAEKPALLEQRGGAFYSEAALGLISSLQRGDAAVHVVDIRNNGTLRGLADDDVVEVPARIAADGPLPLPQEPLAPELLGLTQHVAAYERLTAQAAVTGDRGTARKALLTHPLCTVISDSFYVHGRPHPRLFGAFPEFLGNLTGWGTRVPVDQPSPPRLVAAAGWLFLLGLPALMLFATGNPR